ncbi:MAG TPA: hypothetical protein VI727_07265 [Candidatus Brocadiaceae bacterium]|nr:hypothetical protein [Candidatus Brocadiaceae bacterium]
MSKITFTASLHKVQIDREGESRITLTIPMSEREAVLAVSMLTETALRVKIDIDENQGEKDGSVER